MAFPCSSCLWDEQETWCCIAVAWLHFGCLWLFVCDFLVIVLVLTSVVVVVVLSCCGYCSVGFEQMRIAIRNKGHVTRNNEHRY